MNMILEFSSTSVDLYSEIENNLIKGEIIKPLMNKNISNEHTKGITIIMNLTI